MVITKRIQKILMSYLDAFCLTRDYSRFFELGTPTTVPITSGDIFEGVITRL